MKQKIAFEKESSPKSGWGCSMLPVLIFLATLFGSLLGVAADLGSLGESIQPVLDFASPSPKLRIIGSNTVLGEGVKLADDWQTQFEEQHTWEVEIPLFKNVERRPKIIIEGTGSAAAIPKAAQSGVDLLVFSEPMLPDQHQTLINAGIKVECAAEIGYDVIAFVTDINNTVPDITTRELSSILNGSITNWSEVGGTSSMPIHILVRHGSGTTEVVLQNFTGSTEIPSTFITCENNADCLDQTLSIPGSLYWVSAAWLLTQPPQYMRLILVQRIGVPPENPLQEERFNSDNYPVELMRPLYMYVLSGSSLDPEATKLAKEFLRFVRGVRGQEILEKHKFYTYFDPPADMNVQMLPGFGIGPNGLPVVCQ
jgi:ABC-type phosphate transport system substrate-binding protein